MELREAKCCGTCKYQKYSTRIISSWCDKHNMYEIQDYNICDDYE